MLSDLCFALRLFVKDRWFTAAAATALALGIGANSRSGAAEERPRA